MAYPKKFKEKLERMRAKQPAAKLKYKRMKNLQKIREEHNQTIREIANMDPIEAEKYIREKQNQQLDKPRAKRELIGNMIGMKLQS